jgi:hypothetical protein
MTAVTSHFGHPERALPMTVGTAVNAPTITVNPRATDHDRHAPRLMPASWTFVQRRTRSREGERCPEP